MDSMENKKTQVSILIQTLKNNIADGSSPGDLLSSFLQVIQSVSSYNEPKSLGKSPQNIYNNIKTSITDNTSDPFHTLVDRLQFTEPKDVYIDIASTTVKLLEMFRHDVFQSKVIDLFVEAGYKFIDMEFKLSKYTGIETKYTPDILLEHNGRYVIVEVKMRDPMFLNMKEFYDRYKLSGKYDVIVMNYSYGLIYTYGDIEESVSLFQLDNSSVDYLNYLVEACKRIRHNYEKFDLFNKLDSEGDLTEYSEVINNYEEACKGLSQYQEIMDMFGDYKDELINAIKDFNIDNAATREDLEMAGESLSHYIQKDLVPDIYDEYQKLVSENDYSLFPKVDINVLSMIDNYNLERYEPSQKYSPSLYCLFNKSYKISSSRLQNYKDVFSNDYENHVVDDYSRSAFNLLKNIFSDDDLGVLLGNLTVSTEDELFILPGTSRNSRAHKKKDLLKKSLNLYDLNIYINNTFSYTDKTITRSKDNICGFSRKKYDGETEYKKKTLVFSQKMNDIELIEDIIPKWESHYSKLSMMEDLKTFHSTFSDPGMIDGNLLDNFAYNSYMTSSLFKSLIALSSINSKKYRVVQCTDPNTFCIMLPNGDSKDNKPIRYFTVCMTKDPEEVIHLNKIMGLYHSHATFGNYTVLISKVISLDLNRCKLLATSFSKYMLLTSYYEGFIGYTQNRSIVNFNNYLYTNMITLETLSVTENFKNILLVCYSDYGNPTQLIRDKFTPRIKNYTMLSLAKKMVDAINRASKQRHLIITSQNSVELSDDGLDMLNTGFRSIPDLVMPICGLYTSDPREILQEAYLIFYLGNKTLHGSQQELIDLYCVPLEFEREYSDYLLKNKTVIQEITKDKEYGFSYECMKRSIILAYSKQIPDRDKIRRNLVKDLDLDSHIMSKPQFSSTKSMVTSFTNVDDSVKLHRDMSSEEFNTWLKTVVITDVNTFISESNKKIRELNLERKERKSIEEIMSFESESKPSPRCTPLPSLNMTVKNGNYVITASPSRYVRFVMSDVMSCGNNKVFDEVLNMTSNDNSTLRNMYEKLKDDDTPNIFRIFNKDQRTHKDREIYTGNFPARLCLYAVEKLFLTHNTLIEEEAITIPGDQKHKKMYDQRKSIFRERRYKVNKSTHDSQLLSVSSDASKWSARDSYIKYILAIVYNPFLFQEEKWFFLYCLCRYYRKEIVLTDQVLQSTFSLNKDGISGRFEELTDNYKTNHFTVRSNWLQGNLNRLSSFIHYCSSLTIKHTLDVFNSIYGDRSIMNFMVHSDDSTYDFNLIINRETQTDYNMRSDHGRFIVAMIKNIERKHSIILNKKKTYISSFYKEFLSTLLVGNVLSYFYVADLLPIASDMSYKSPLDDLASMSSFIQNSYAHSAPYRMVKAALNIINYTVTSTYNLNNTSRKSAISLFTNPENSDESFSMVPITVMPIYRYPVELAGILPYYAADAFYILHSIIDRSEVDHSKTLESQLTIDSINKFLDNTSMSYKNYIKLCLYSYDSTIFDPDSEDPYNTSTYDLAIKSIINVHSHTARGKVPRYRSYQEFSNRKEEIHDKYIMHPEWILAKPTDLNDCRDSILSNYLMPNFIDSLKYSTTPRDYAKRIIDSNGKLYRLNVRGYLQDESYTMIELCQRLKEIAYREIVDPAKLLAYIKTMLFSDKEISYALQTWYMKQESARIAKASVEMKVTIPKSLFSRDRGALSVTTILNDLFVRTGTMKVSDSKAESIIVYSHNLLTSFDLSSVKIYQEQNLDEDYYEYCKSKDKTKKPEYEDFVTCMDAADNEDYRAMVIEVRQIFKSLLIRYYTDMKKLRSNKDFVFESYPTPQSVLSTIDKYSRKDVVSHKVYMSAKRNTRKDDYWLSRLGMYQDEYMYVKYSVGTRYALDKSDKLQSTESDRTRIQAFTKFISLMIRDDADESDMQNIVIEGMTYKDYINKIRKTENINHKIMLNKLEYISSSSVFTSLSSDPIMRNNWLIPHSETDNNDLSHVIYLYKGVFMKVYTMKTEAGISLDVKFYKRGEPDPDATFRLLSKFSKDYKLNLINKKIVSQSTNRNNIVYRDSYGTFTTCERDRNRNLNSLAFYYDFYQYRDISDITIEIDQKNRYNYSFNIMGDNTLLFPFSIRDNIYYEPQAMSEYCWQNIKNTPTLLSLALKHRFINKENAFHYLSNMDLQAITNITLPGDRFSSNQGSIDDYTRSILKSFIKTHRDAIQTSMIREYNRFGSDILDLVEKLNSDVTNISYDKSAYDKIMSVAINRRDKDMIKYTHFLPYNNIFYKCLTGDDNISDLMALLLYLIRYAVEGDDYFLDLKKGFLSEDDDDYD